MKKLILSTLIIIHSSHSTPSLSLLSHYASMMYNKMPTLSVTMKSMFYLIVILNVIKPHWFPGFQRGIINPEQTRVNISKIRYESSVFKKEFFTQWVDLNNLENQFKRANISINNYETLTKKEQQSSKEQKVQVSREMDYVEHNISGEVSSYSFVRVFLSKFQRKHTIHKSYQPHFYEGSYAYLLQGPPGCGKSSFPIYLAAQYNIPLYNITSTDLTTDHTGSTATNFKNIVQAAYAAARGVENRLAFIVINDVDTLLSSNNSAELSALKTYMLHYFDIVQKKQLAVNRDTHEEQKKQQAEVIFFLTANYSQTFDLNALTRQGRCTLINYALMKRTTKFNITEIMWDGIYISGNIQQMLIDLYNTPQYIPITFINYFKTKSKTKSYVKDNSNLIKKINMKNQFKSFELKYESSNTFENQILIDLRKKYKFADIPRCMELFSLHEMDVLKNEINKPQRCFLQALRYIDSKILAMYTIAN